MNRETLRLRSCIPAGLKVMGGLNRGAPASRQVEPAGLRFLDLAVVFMRRVELRSALRPVKSHPLAEEILGAHRRGAAATGTPAGLRGIR